MRTGGPFVSPEGAELMDATARLAAVQTLLKEMQTFQAAMSLEQLSTEKHFAWMDAKLWEFQKELDRLGLVGRTPYPSSPTSSG